MRGRAAPAQVPAAARGSVGRAANPPAASSATDRNAVSLEVVRQPSIGGDSIGELVPSSVLDEEMARESIRLDIGTVEPNSIAGIVCFVCQGKGERMVKGEPQPSYVSGIGEISRSITVEWEESNMAEKESKEFKEPKEQAPTSLGATLLREFDASKQAHQAVDFSSLGFGVVPAMQNASRQQQPYKFKYTGTGAHRVIQKVVLRPTECWVCEGTGKLSAYINSLALFEDSQKIGGETKMSNETTSAAEEKTTELDDCLICWTNKARYGLSTTCAHFFCAQCAKESLENMMQEGKFLDRKAFCPLCQMEAGAGKTPPVGEITGKVLTFLEHRGIIDEAFQFRFMRQLNELSRTYFTCPSVNCNKKLLEAKEIKWIGPRHAPYTKPGQCPCGQLICVSCHEVSLSLFFRSMSKTMTS